MQKFKLITWSVRSLKSKPNTKPYVCPFLYLLSNTTVEILCYSSDTVISPSFPMWKTSTEQFSPSKLNRTAQMSNACAQLFRIWWLTIFQWVHLVCKANKLFKSKLFTQVKKNTELPELHFKKLHDFTFYLFTWKNWAHVPSTKQLQKFTKQLWKAFY